MKRGILVLAAAAATAVVLSATGSAAPVTGVVVAKQRGVLLVASPSGAVRAVHARASIGARLVGTHVVGRATHARIHGIVVRRIGTTVVLSSNRHLIAIPNRVARRLAGTAPASTAPGDVVNAQVAIRNGELEEENEDRVGQVNASTLTIQATVKAIAPGSVTLDVQGQAVVVPLPAGLTLPASLVNQTVTLNVALDNRRADDDENDDDDDDHAVTTTTTTTTTTTVADDHGDHHRGGGDDDHSGHGGGGDD
jgi:hypothetical protein